LSSFVVGGAGLRGEGELAVPEEGDMREWTAGRTWAEVRPPQEHAVVDHGKAGLPLVDRYTHADEYRWQTAWSTSPEWSD
jgi:hypothetical protein